MDLMSLSMGLLGWMLASIPTGTEVPRGVAPPQKQGRSER